MDSITITISGKDREMTVGMLAVKFAEVLSAEGHGVNINGKDLTLGPHAMLLKPIKFKEPLSVKFVTIGDQS